MVTRPTAETPVVINGTTVSVYTPTGTVVFTDVDIERDIMDIMEMSIN